MDFDLLITYQSHYFDENVNDHTVNTNILPQAVSRKTQIEVQFLTKVLKVIFSKVGDSVWGLYLIF